MVCVCDVQPTFKSLFCTARILIRGFWNEGNERGSTGRTERGYTTDWNELSDSSEWVAGEVKWSEVRRRCDA